MGLVRTIPRNLKVGSYETFLRVTFFGIWYEIKIEFCGSYISITQDWFFKQFV